MNCWRKYQSWHFLNLVNDGVFTWFEEYYQSSLPFDGFIYRETIKDVEKHHVSHSCRKFVSKLWCFQGRDLPCSPNISSAIVIVIWLCRSLSKRGYVQLTKTSTLNVWDWVWWKSRVMKPTWADNSLMLMSLMPMPCEITPVSQIYFQRPLYKLVVNCKHYEKAYFYIPNPCVS